MKIQHNEHLNILDKYITLYLITKKIYAFFSSMQGPLMKTDLIQSSKARFKTWKKKKSGHKLIKLKIKSTHNLGKFWLEINNYPYINQGITYF